MLADKCAGIFWRIILPRYPGPRRGQRIARRREILNCRKQAITRFDDGQ